MKQMISRKKQQGDPRDKISELDKRIAFREVRLENSAHYVGRFAFFTTLASIPLQIEAAMDFHQQDTTSGIKKILLSLVIQSAIFPIRLAVDKVDTALNRRDEAKIEALKAMPIPERSAQQTCNSSGSVVVVNNKLSEPLPAD